MAPRSKPAKTRRVTATSRTALASFLLALGCAPGLACNREGDAPPAHEEDTGPLPILGQVPEFSLTSHTGASFGSEELGGKPYLAAFMFTRCPSVCPRLTERMAEVADRVKADGRTLEFVSISVDPEHDTPPVLTEFAKKHGALRPNWTLLTGDSDAIRTTAESGFKIGVTGAYDASKPDMGITHGSHLILVDARGRIRGFYRSFDDDTVAQVVGGLQRLTKTP